tara:strand:- start:1136 stop:1519 length:384 start_codon:yes stop_codon:yes gene_type:complete
MYKDAEVEAGKQFTKRGKNQKGVVYNVVDELTTTNRAGEVVKTECIYEHDFTNISIVGADGMTNEQLIMYCVKDVYYHAGCALAEGDLDILNRITVDMPWCENMEELQDVANKLRDILKSMGLSTDK